MKKLNRKGFTIIELVIVIAVIAILAAVMVPTFSSIVTKAKKSAVEQEAAALYKEALAIDLADGKNDAKEGETSINQIGDKTFTYEADGTKVTKFEYTSEGYKVTYNTTTKKLNPAVDAE